MKTLRPIVFLLIGILCLVTNENYKVNAAATAAVAGDENNAAAAAGGLRRRNSGNKRRLGAEETEFYFRMTYAFMPDTKPPSWSEDMPSVLQRTNEMYLDSLSGSVQFVHFHMDEGTYLFNSDQFVMVGTVTVVGGGNTSPLMLRNAFDEDVYIGSYLTRTSPNTNIFRFTMAAFPEFDDSTPFALPEEIVQLPASASSTNAQQGGAGDDRGGNPATETAVASSPSIPTTTTAASASSSCMRSPTNVNGQSFVERNLFYRMTYTFVEGSSRRPEPEELPDLQSMTEQYYFESICNNLGGSNADERIANVRFVVDNALYDYANENFVLVGTITVAFDRTGRIPLDDEVYQEVSRIDPYHNYLFMTKPATSIFRFTRDANAEFHPETSFVIPIEVNRDIISIVDDNGSGSPPEDRGVVVDPSTTTESISTQGSCMRSVAGGSSSVARQLFFKLTYTFQGGAGRSPSLDELNDIMSVTDQFYFDSICTDLQDGGGEVMDNVAFHFDDAIYDYPHEQFVVVGHMNIYFDPASGEVPSDDVIVQEALRIDPTGDYLLISPSPSSIFRFTSQVDSDFDLTEPYHIRLSSE